MSLMSAGGRAFTPMMLASRTGVTSGRTRLSSEVTCDMDFGFKEKITH